MHCTSQADVMMTEKSTTDELPKDTYTQPLLSLFLGKSEQPTCCLCWKQCLLVSLLL